MENWIIIGILLLVLGGAGWYIYKAKKSGKKCIGCPDSASCGSKKEGASGCECCCGCSGCGTSNDREAT